MAYDNNGNRTSTNGGGTYQSNDLNQYIIFAGVGVDYDDNGNLKTYYGNVASYNGWTYTYDAQNRLKVVKHGDTIVEQFWYDGLNRIITKNLNGNVTYHVYDAWNLIEEYAGPYSPPPPPPTPTPAPTATATATATATLIPTATPTATPPGPEATPTATVTPGTWTTPTPTPTPFPKATVAPPVCDDCGPETTFSNQMAGEGAASPSAPINVYLYAGDQIIKNVTMGYFYYQDSLGNTSHVTDAAGTLLESYTYSGFGTPTFYNASGGIIYDAAGISQSAKGIRHLFQGQLWTQETGLNDYRNRVEFPTMGVFLQPDPIGFKGDAANLYRFCTNDPINRSDPMGLRDDEPTPQAEARTQAIARGTLEMDGLQGPGKEAARAMAVSHYVNTGALAADVQGRVDAFNKSQSAWKAGFTMTHGRASEFKPNVAATVSWDASASVAYENGKVSNVTAKLDITMRWNDDAPGAHQAVALLKVGGEIEHVTDALRYVNSPGQYVQRTFWGPKQVIVPAGAATARSLMGTNTSPAAANDALNNWARGSMAASNSYWDDSGRHSPGSLFNP